MEPYTCLFVIFLGSVIDFATAIKSKSVNLALETVLEFDNKENSVDVHLIDNVQNFLQSVKTLIAKPKSRRSGTKPGIITDFLQNAAEILKSYDDDDLEDFVSILANELKSYNYKGCKFNELVENNNVRRYSVDKLREYRRVPGKEIRKKLARMKSNLANDSVNDNVKRVLEYIDSLYGERDRKRFKRFLGHLEKYRHKSKRFNLDLVDIIRTNVRSLLFDYYTNLTQNAKNELKDMIDTLWKNENSKTNNPYENKENVRHIKETKSADKPSVLKKPDLKTQLKGNNKVNTHSTTTEKSVNKIRFISLYPEAITTKKTRMTRVKSNNKKPKKEMKSPENSENIAKIIHKNSDNLSDDDLNDDVTKRGDRKIRKHHTTTKKVSSTTRNGEDMDSNAEADITFKGTFRSAHMSTEEGLTIESFEDSSSKHRFRRGNVDETLSNTDKPIVDNVIKRIVNLENDMKDVKSKILGRVADGDEKELNQKESRRQPYESLPFNSNPSALEDSTTAPISLTNVTSVISTSPDGIEIFVTGHKNITTVQSTLFIVNTTNVLENGQPNTTIKVAEPAKSHNVTKDYNISINTIRLQSNTNEIDYQDYNYNATDKDELQPTTFPRITKNLPSKKDNQSENHMILGDIATVKAEIVSSNKNDSKRELEDYYKSEQVKGVDDWD